MIDLHRLANILREIKSDEIKILQTLEETAHRFEFAPLEEVANKLPLESDDVLFYLSQLNKIKLVQRQHEHYLGYRITRSGYDVLALYDLASKDVIVSLGRPYGVGKEATVYRALNPQGKEFAVKFLWWGQTSFKRVRRLRKLKDEPIYSWMDLSKRAASREFTALQLLNGIGGNVPQPIAINRHIIVMSQMSGDLLLRIKTLKNPIRLLEQIINQIQLAYQEAKLIHGDLSEYNVFVDENDRITIFDWPQWQPINHPNALWLLKRDISNILGFFKRRFRVVYNIDEILTRVTERTARKKKNVKNY